MPEFRISFLLNALVFTVAGLLVFAAAMAAVDRLMPQRIWKSIVEEKNMALAIVVSALAIAMATIVAATMH